MPSMLSFKVPSVFGLSVHALVGLVRKGSGWLEWVRFSHLFGNVLWTSSLLIWI